MEDQLEPSILSYKVTFFNGPVATIASLKGYMEQIFGSRYLLKTATFLEDLSWAFDFFKGSIYISPLLLQKSIPWSSVSVFITERILATHSFKSCVFILIGELGVIHCLSISSSSTVFIYFFYMCKNSNIQYNTIN